MEGDRYEYEMNALMSFARKRIPIMEVPIHTVYRDKSNSTSHFHAFWDSVRIYKNIFKFTLFSLTSFILEIFVHILHFPVYLAKLLTESILFLVSWLIQDGVIFRNKGKGRLYREV